MANENVSGNQKLRLRYRGRMLQTTIYLGKLFRSFLYQNDWKLIPLSAAVAGLLALVIRRGFGVSMEGTLTGSFALSCCGIWNGYFNSIQSVCRERQVLKREHRSGMHISSYIIANMIYQALICLVQTGVLLYICLFAGVHLPNEGAKIFFVSSEIINVGFTVFLVTYAADMMSLFISSVVHSTTAAMTIMPFLLIFQLVFSGGIFSLPSWASKFSAVTFSNYGLRCIAAQAHYNDLPMAETWKTLNKMRDEEIPVVTTVGAVMDLLTDQENEGIRPLRETEITPKLTFGQAADLAAKTQEMQGKRDEVIETSFTLQQIIDILGEDAVKEAVQYKTAEANQRKAFESTEENIHYCWTRLAELAALFALLSLIALELIDKDRR